MPPQPPPPYGQPGAGYGQPGYAQPPPGYGPRQPYPYPYPPPGYQQGYGAPGYGYAYGPPPPPPVDPTVHNHDGFYFRFSLGVGRLAPTVEVDAGGQKSEAKFSGSTLAADLMLGGTIGRHVVLGGGLASLSVSDAEVERQGVKGDANQSLQLSIGGPFVDVYPDPGGGLHFQGMLGVASLVSRPDSSSRSSQTLSGFGLAGGVGYDFWIASQWSLGLMARIHYASVDKTIDGADNKSSTVAPALLLTALLH